MNKAFTKDDSDAPDPGEPLPPRPSEPAPITPRGYKELRDELDALTSAQKASTRRALIVKSILDTVTVREPALENDGVGFGCVVTVEREDGSRALYELVGPDEAQPALGRISFVSPIARALMRQKVGASVVVKKPKGDETLSIVELHLLG